jgi:DNA repair exonuclease SbcCD ATPase subunit
MALDVDVPPGTPDGTKDYDYKSRCEDLEAALNETRSALDEFQFSSRELEAELERELENMEKQYTDAKRQKERLRMESDEWKVTHPFSPWAFGGLENGVLIWVE